MSLLTHQERGSREYSCVQYKFHVQVEQNKTKENKTKQPHRNLKLEVALQNICVPQIL